MQKNKLRLQSGFNKLQSINNTLRSALFRTLAVALISFAAVAEARAEDPTAFELDSLALVALFNATDGANWNNNTGWLQGNVDSWFGVTRVQVVSGERRVQRMNLEGNGLNGTIPAEMGNLTQMRHLEIGRNNISGEIPIEFWNMFRLERLALERQPISGQLPPQIGNLTNLQRLYLDGMQLSGDIPEELWGLSSLQRLYLDQNEFTGQIPAEIGNLTNLQRLYLNDNYFTGPFPAEVWGLHQHMERLHLGGSTSEFTNIGDIPAELANFTRLEQLYIYEMGFTGEIPEFIFSDLLLLQRLYLYGNELTGGLSAGVGNLWNMERLYLNNNNLTGSMPNEIDELWELEHLRIQHNDFSGSLPAGLDKMPKLTELMANNNQFTGSVPAEWSVLTELQFVSLSDNELTGPMPEFLGGLDDLRFLNLSNNMFDGELPDSWGGLSMLDVMDISFLPDITGPVPMTFTGLENLRVFHFNETGLCEPPDEAFQAWLSSVEAKAESSVMRSGVECEPTYAGSGEQLPVKFTLQQNYPNPFNPSTSIRYAIPDQAHVTFTVYNTLGQVVAVLVNEPKSAGWHSVTFDAGRLSSGLYIYRVQAGNKVDTRQMMLLK
jgi:Leucine-rich repeat (LRR) protein